VTEDDLQAIEARANAAMPGPWHLAITRDDDPDRANIEAGPIDVADDAQNDDAVFIASARTDVPALVAEVRRLRAIAEIALRPEIVYDDHVQEIARKHGSKATDDAIGKAAATIACIYAIREALKEVGVEVT
jgi:hypothetical protein